MRLRAVLKAAGRLRSWQSADEHAADLASQAGVWGRLHRRQVDTGIGQHTLTPVHVHQWSSLVQAAPPAVGGGALMRHANGAELAAWGQQGAKGVGQPSLPRGDAKLLEVRQLGQQHL